MEAASRTQGSRLEEARFTLERIDEVDPKPGEYEELEESLPRAEHAEALAGCANDASQALSGEGGALDALNTAIAELSRMGGVDAKLASFADELTGAAITIEDAAAELRRYRDSVDYDPAELAASRMGGVDAKLASFADELTGAAITIEDAAAELRRYRDSVDYDPAELAAAQERFSSFRGLLRQWGPRMEDVFARRAEAAELLNLVDDAEARVRRARDARDAAEADLARAARALTKRRTAAAPRFCREVGKQMARLEMGRAELVWESRELPRDRSGRFSQTSRARTR